MLKIWRSTLSSSSEMSGGSACSSIDIHWNPYKLSVSHHSWSRWWAPGCLVVLSLVNYNIQIQTTRKYFILPFTYFRSVRHCLNSFEMLECRLHQATARERWAQNHLRVIVEDIVSTKTLPLHIYIHTGSIYRVARRSAILPHANHKLLKSPNINGTAGDDSWPTNHSSHYLWLTFLVRQS